MSGFELVASVVAIFFVMGIAAGVLVVAALPGLRRIDRRYVDDGVPHSPDEEFRECQKPRPGLVDAWGESLGKADAPGISLPRK
jgi:hypothetical protein